ncbi:MAG TPA: hypothetical protein VJ827_10880 [Rubrobacter sp.]|nr:hypothetical protein [Rubrobacter sp.]
MLKDIARQGEENKGRGPTDTNPCGCVLSEPTKSSGRRVIQKCPEGERLFGLLVDARDAECTRRKNATRKGRKRSIDAFAEARDAFRIHIFGEGVG